MARATAKAILLGEHAAVYGVPAIAVPLPARATVVEVVERGAPGAVDVRDERGIDTALAERMVRRALESEGRGGAAAAGVRVAIRSTIPLGGGLGSSAALAVAIVRALPGEATLLEAQVAARANDLDALAHGTPSGIDAATIAHGRPIRFQKGEEPLPIALRAPLRLAVGVLPREGTTASLVAGVRALRDRDPAAFERILGRVKDAVRRGLACLVEGVHEEDLAIAIESNQSALRDMGVVPQAASRACQAAVRAGALAAKVSGAGGGGAIVALLGAASDPEAVLAALRKSGATDAFQTEVPLA
jgi:mevalonate kinase